LSARPDAEARVRRTQPIVFDVNGVMTNGGMDIGKGGF
jgi:3-deoxy-D-manno-octulosonate 8-phosphate phosphatase KdsC-like HAD superfamily phosphatase